jgi:hypothetical protein
VAMRNLIDMVPSESFAIVSNPCAAAPSAHPEGVRL